MDYFRSLRGKNVLVTGASSGIGEACVKAFAREGANLIFCARNIEKLKYLENEITDRYRVKTFIGKVDVRSLEQVNHFLSSIPDELSKLDILVNNAGLALGLEKFYEGDPDDWDTMIDTNIKGLLYFSKNVLSSYLFSFI